jgi:hypothetical protein
MVGDLAHLSECDVCWTGEDLQRSPDGVIVLCAACRADYAKRECGDCGVTWSHYAPYAEGTCANEMHSWLGWVA